MAQNCNMFLTYRHVHPKQPVMSYNISSQPWQKVTADLFQYHNKTYQIIVDIYADVCQTPTQSSSAMITTMQHSFSRFTVPREVFTDKNPCFASTEYQQFASEWDFNILTASPDYQKSNGLAEKIIKTVKKYSTNI